MILRAVSESGQNIGGFAINEDEVSKVRVFTDTALSELLVCCVKANFMEEKAVGESDAIALTNGAEVLDAIEGRVLPSGLWQKIGGHDKSLSFGTVAQSETIELELRLDLKEISLSHGSVAAALVFRAVEA